MQLAANDQRQFRLAVEKEIERLIALLDNLAGDCDLEDSGDEEPTHGWPNNGQSCTSAMSCDDEREVDTADDEPSLGWGSHVNQWSPSRIGTAGTFDPDREIEGDEDDFSGDEGDQSCGELDGGQGL